MASMLKSLLFLFVIAIFTTISPSKALSRNFYANICPDVEEMVREAVEKKAKETFITIPATLRLYFHDCFVNGCDASIMIASTKQNKAEKDHEENLSLAGDGFDTVIKAKKAVDAVSNCRYKVSCADILTMATRDAIYLMGGPYYEVELGRYDGVTSTADSVEGNLPLPTDDVNNLTALFAKKGLDVDDIIVLSGSHRVGVAHCTSISHRLYGEDSTMPIDPVYASNLRKACPKDVDRNKFVFMVPNSSNVFDNAYYRNLKELKGVFESDQALYTDPRSKPFVEELATDGQLFHRAFARSMIKLGRVGVKTVSNGNIRRRCDAFN
ncbi:hypothetical protein CARUB_v10007328mg [Capsella rubella]|uniref:Peroxidase n=1 Tax=Capsella rubella TaxID=81985 RepID=R0F9S6_9BRAS|nr:peroxidase 50 [Capsella rubella]EOA18747.1 hypothetical protein CARUB_v10007328mg [Capsella rubella]